MKQIMKEIKTIAATLVLALGLAYGFTSPVSAQGASGKAKTDVCAGVNLGGGTCSGGASELERVIKAVVQILSIIAGIAAVIMLIVGGLRYITAGGEASGIASAKSAIIYAIVGLIIVAVSQVIVRYVLNKTTGP